MRWAVFVLFGCGRLGFDPTLTPTDAAGDASVTGQCAEQVPGLIARFPLDGDATNTGLGGEGVELGGVGYAPGLIDRALLLDGVDDVVQLPPVAIDDYTLSFWVRTTDVGTGTSTDLWFDGKSLVDAEVCGATATGDFGTVLIDGGHVAGAGTVVHSTTVINDDAWHHVVFTRDLAGSTMAFYVDGAFIDSGMFPGAGFSHTEIPWIGIGNNPCRIDQGVNFFAGLIDEVTFHDRVMSAPEVLSLFECVTGP
ncbi:MAG: LamG domain-containing protein [Deltaproteobacteria bacterium]|nr:LamG domain-containing protein [Deltaproteobacteria bacterium]